MKEEDLPRPSDALLAQQIELEQQNEELRRGQSVLEAAQSRYHDLYDLAPAGYLTLSDAGMILEANLCAARLLGTDRSRLLKQPFFRFVHPEDREALHRHCKAPLEPSTSRVCELRMLRTDAPPAWVRLETASGHSSDGTPALLSVLVDVTEGKRVEAALADAQRLESLGVLAGGIAHNFNNILTALLGNLFLLRKEAFAGAEAAEILSDAEASCRRAAELANQLLTFGKGGRPVLQVLDLGPLLVEAVAVAARGEKVRCALELAPDLPPVMADGGQVAQVIYNLLINAAEAMPDGGNITVRAAAAPGRRVQVTVADTGQGIAPEHLAEVFEPFFSTRNKGRGLGLAICHAIMAKHGGSITARSKPGEGAVFTLTLPAADVPGPQAETAPPAAVAGGGRILVMDDDEAVSKMLRRMLERQGYRVDTVPEGGAAVVAYRRARESGAPFAVVIVDLTVPNGMGGMRTFEELIKTDSKAKVIVSSGYSDDPVMAEWADRGFAGALPKPYDSAEVAATLRRVMAS